ncbi:E3 ubiquitin-protein ligase bre1 [Linnemannia exigua]|uniref:E3 ubiquitin protein ligase n=1 Tax=Linnemannia exigua TaxID=604196 RepID=A0AAD4H975_9FUNG|nr:E3 ubiquitin-protein ligase bre1 [Linnemannia exigua]
MEDRSNRKRRLTDDVGPPFSSSGGPATNGSPAATPATTKRQFTGSGSGSASPQNIGLKDDSETLTAAEEVLLNFQKEAIWRQIQEYKRENVRAQERIERLKDHQVGYDERLSELDSHWNKLLEDLRTIISRSRMGVDPADMTLKEGDGLVAAIQHGPAEESEWQEVRELTEEAVKKSVEKRSRSTKDLALKLLCMVEAWSEKRDRFWSSLKADPSVQGSRTVQQLVQTHEALVQQHKKGRTAIDRLQAQCHEYSDQVLRLKNDLQMTKYRLEETSGELDHSKDRLRRMHRTMEREKNTTSLGVAAEYGTAADFGLTSASLLGDMSEATRDELLQCRRLAISRQVELDEMKGQDTQVREEVEKTRAQLAHISEEKIQDSQHVKALLVQMQSVRHESEFYRSEVLRLRSDLDDLHSSRRKFVDTLENEEKNRRAALEAELKKLESDISRVQDSRNKFQQMYENRCTKDDYEMQQNQEIRKIANTRKDRITSLTADIQRLQTMLAANSDDWQSYAFYLKGPSDHAALKDLRDSLKAADEHISNLQMELEAYKEVAQQVREYAAVKESEAQLKDQVATLSSRVAELENVVGSGAKDSVKTLVATLEDKETTLRRLELKVQAHEAVQVPLLNELHTVATAWGLLEEATSRKAIDLAQKEDLIFKLLSDKTRQESKCTHLVRAKEQSANMTTVMKRQSDMQLEQIQRLEEREKALGAQMATFEKEQTVLSSEVTVHKTKLQELTQHNSSFKEKFTKQEERLVEVQTLLKEKTDAYESEAQVRKKLMEESESMKKKLEEQNKKSESSSSGGETSEVAKQAARYLQLLKCPACDVNFKSHVILRCMHVFCKSCMDKQMEYRQRKCPTCRENFGAKDVKEIYL